jgi:hypothetical protein
MRTELFGSGVEMTGVLESEKRVWASTDALNVSVFRK